SKLEMRSTPLWPASSAFQVSSTLLPTAQIRPMPVTTTRRSKLLRSFRVRCDVVDGVLDGADLFSVLVGNLDFESLFESHDQLDCVERVGAQIVYERGGWRDLRFVYAELLHDDLFYTFVNGCHCRFSPFDSLSFLRLRVLVDIGDSVLHRADFLRVFVGYLDF